jgi:alcohol dehydrogenase class IV
MSNDAIPLSANWNYPTAVQFGAGRISEIGKVCKAQGMKRPLLVTDPGLAGLPMIPAALSELEAAGIPGAVMSAATPSAPTSKQASRCSAAVAMTASSPGAAAVPWTAPRSSP